VTVLPSARLHELGLALPAAPAPVGSYVPARVHAGLVFITGQLAFVDGVIAHPGLLGAEVTRDQGVQAAQVCALNAIAAGADAVGGIDELTGVLSIVGYLACAPGFTELSAVLNGASDLLADVFGPEGVHTRTNVGVATLPLGTPVEVQVTFATAVK
jgi:enamine deaminase RidA (YjgF/YER057c/UK114 family)